MNRSRFRVRVRFWQKLEALHEPVTVQGPCAVLAKNWRLSMKLTVSRRGVGPQYLDVSTAIAIGWCDDRSFVVQIVCVIVTSSDQPIHHILIVWPRRNFAATPARPYHIVKCEATRKFPTGRAGTKIATWNNPSTFGTLVEDHRRSSIAASFSGDTR